MLIAALLFQAPAPIRTGPGERREPPLAPKVKLD
jgi:hypothetical protein